ncbi:CYFA0S35e00474g1_1 [Cyberlindnera fabianii]|uniref:CYFA0S35e00474g1_1 n=1 Tax=Cyberlindnera fabianii TaxID=36022 RepID=A0A061BID1_CYBFA|nr:CYFA0S35e00474g1_1 [Cyberlindnera fabianii]
MSTYEDEHNIQTQHTERAPDHEQHRRPHQTLATLLQGFFAETDNSAELHFSPSGANVPLEQFTRALETLEGLPIQESLLEQLEQQKEVKGVSQEFIDSLERVNKKSLKPDMTCSICTADFVDDPHPLVVRLPCDGKHKFDLECIAPWLKVHSKCPLCRKDLLEKKKFVDLPKDDEEEDEDWDMYG